MKNTFSRFIVCFPLMIISLGVLGDGLNADLAILKINKDVKSLNNEILVLKDEIEILRENQRLNSEKIDELLQMIDLSRTNKKQSEKSIAKSSNDESYELFKDGKSSFVLGNYDKAIELFLSHLATSPSAQSITDTQLWLGRSYFYSEFFLKSKKAYLKYLSMDGDHAKRADSLYELSRVHLELNEINEAKNLLTQMLEDYPEHILFNKASALLQSL